MTRPAPTKRLARLLADKRGGMAIETAFVAPVLVLLALGAFEVSNIVSRQHELQSGVAEAEAMVLAAGAGPSTDAVAVATELRQSLALGDDQVEVTKVYRCDTAGDLVEAVDACGEDQVVSSYLRIELKDAYAPMWQSFGVSKTFDFDVRRTVQLS